MWIRIFGYCPTFPALLGQMKATQHSLYHLGASWLCQSPCAICAGKSWARQAGYLCPGGCMSLVGPSLSDGGPLRPDPGTTQVCLFSCVLAVPPCPCPGKCAQLASLGTRLSCSSLIYYKGDGDKQPREPPRIQCPHSHDLSVAMSQEAGDGISAGSASFV